MSLSANILAIALMVVTPFLRPCACVGFTLWCFCESHSHESCDCEGHHHDEDCEHSHQTPQPEKDVPCGDVAPAVATTILAAEGVVGRETPNPDLGFLNLAWGRTFQPVSRVQPPDLDQRGPPTSPGLIVVQTNFLRI